jgi:hypothetical protein
MLENMLRAMQMRYMDDMPKARCDTGRATTTTKEKKAGYLTSIQTPFLCTPMPMRFSSVHALFRSFKQIQERKEKKNMT